MSRAVGWCGGREREGPDAAVEARSIRMQGNLCYVGSVRDMAGPPFQITSIHSSPIIFQGWSKTLFPPPVAIITPYIVFYKRTPKKRNQKKKRRA